MSERTLPHTTADFLSSRSHALLQLPITAGLDGFVDTILHVVATRESTDGYVRQTSMEAFGKRIVEAVKLSTNFEMVPQMVKLGGNGPILATALRAYGVPVTYVGLLGVPHIHSVFADIAERAEIISLAEPGYTDALEFEDGTLMFGRHTSLREVNWENLLLHLPLEQLIALFQKSALIALLNWTMLIGLTRIFEELLNKVMPRLRGPRWMFFDLGDPAKRTPEDLAYALGLISRFQQNADVILGMNLSEAKQIGRVVGLGECEESAEAVGEYAASIRYKLGLHTVFIHPVAFSVAADANGIAMVPSVLVENPKVVTGAGGYCSAGFCIGRVLGAPLDISLQLGVCTSSYYVRTAKNPTVEDMVNFLRSL